MYAAGFFHFWIAHCCHIQVWPPCFHLIKKIFSNPLQRTSSKADFDSLKTSSESRQRPWEKNSKTLVWLRFSSFFWHPMSCGHYRKSINDIKDDCLGVSIENHFRISWQFLRSRVSDPHWFNVDPDLDPEFFLIADPDSGSGSRIRIQGLMI